MRNKNYVIEFQENLPVHLYVVFLDGLDGHQNVLVASDV